MRLFRLSKNQQQNEPTKPNSNENSSLYSDIAIPHQKPRQRLHSNNTLKRDTLHSKFLGIFKIEPYLIIQCKPIHAKISIILFDNLQGIWDH